MRARKSGEPRQRHYYWPEEVRDRLSTEPPTPVDHEQGRTSRTQFVDADRGQRQAKPIVQRSARSGARGW
jgi:hypothetical protein